MCSMDKLLIPFRKSTLWGYCTPDKTIVIPCEYEWAGVFRGDTAVVRGNGKYGAVNREGRLFIPFTYPSLCRAEQEIYMQEDILPCMDYDEEVEGTCEGPPLDEGEICTYAGVDFIYSRRRYRALDASISTEVYEGLGDFWDGLIWVVKNKKWGAIDPSGRQVIPCMYEEIEPFDDDYPDYTFVVFQGRLGVINHNNVQYWED